MKIFRHWAFYVVLVIVLLVVTSVILVNAYKDEIKVAVNKKINKHFVSELSIGDLRLSIFKRFPRITIILDDVKIKEHPHFGNDDLASIEHLYLVLNLKGFFRNEFVIERMDMNNGSLTVKIDKYGKENFNVLKPGEEESDKKGSLGLDLTKIAVNDIKVSYKDQKNNYFSSAEIDNLTLSGFFNEKATELSVSADILSDSVFADSSSWLKDTKLAIEGKLKADSSFSHFIIENTSIDINDLVATIWGEVDYNEDKEEYELNLDFEAVNLALPDIKNLVPGIAGAYSKDLEYKGDLSLDCSVKGFYSSKKTPLVEANISLEDGNLVFVKYNKELYNISFQGFYTNGKSHSMAGSKLELRNIKASFGKKDIASSVIISNFIKPIADISLDANVDLSDFEEFLDSSGVNKIKGEAFVDLAFKGKLYDIRNNISQCLLSGKILFSNVYLSIDSSAYDYKDMNGELMVNGNKLTIKTFSGMVNKSYFNLDGVADNILNYLFVNAEELTISARLFSKFIDLGELVEAEYQSDATESTDAPSSSVSYIGIIPPRVKMDLDIRCNSLVYDKFKASNISGRVLLSDKAIRLRDIRFTNSGGSVVVNGRIDETVNDQFNIQGTAKCKQVDISNVFYELNNFDQTYIVDKNLKGRVDADVEINSYWNPDLSCDNKKLWVIADLIATNGELIEFKPLMDVMGFAKLKKSRNIVFSKLENTILIKEEVIYIPKMNVYSNAFSMQIAGEQTFDYIVDYVFVFNLSDFFFRTNRMSDADIANYEPDAKGGFNVYISMKGSTDDPVYKFEKLGFGNKQNQNLINTQRTQMKNLFKQNTEKENTEEFEVEWEEK